MKKLCLECCHETEVKLDYISEKTSYQNREFTYTAEVYKCEECGKEVPSNELYDKNLETSVKVYKEIFKMLTAEDFKYIRETIYNLSTRTLATLIGCSPATISKYENGALQSKQHDLQFKQLISPKNMINLYNASKDEIKKTEQIKIEERLAFLLEAVKVEELLKGLNNHLELPNLPEVIENSSPIAIEQLEQFFLFKGQLDTNEEEGIDYRISNLKLQKLMYYAEGWHLAITDTPLISDSFEAWKHGPVVKETYHKYKPNKANPIDLSCDLNSFERLNLNQNQIIILEWVWDKYSHFDAKYLEELTHNEMPWIQARQSLPLSAASNRIIDKDDIKSYFKNVYTALGILNRNDTTLI